MQRTMPIDLEHGRSEAFPKRFRDLADMRHLFHRRTNKGGQTFPFRLPDNSQPGAKIPGGVHRLVVRERRANFRQGMIEREIIADHLL